MPVPNIPGKLKYTNQGGVVFGDTEANNTTLEEGWLAVNTDNDTLSLHDGVTNGGKSLITSSGITKDATDVSTAIRAVKAPFGVFPRTTVYAGYKVHGGAKNSSSLDVVNPAYSIAEQIQALAPYSGIRVHVFNHDTVAKTLTLAKSAPCPTDNNPGTSTIGYTTLKKDGVDVSSLTVPAATFVSTTDVDVDDISPGILSLDYLDTRNVARTDLPNELPLHLIRTLWTNGVRPINGVNPIWRANTGLQFKSFGSSYDFVTGNNSAATNDSYSYITTMVEFSYLKPSLTVLTLGDSTNTGVGTTAGNWTYIDEAARLGRFNNLPTLIVPNKMASSGRRQVGMLNSLKGVINSGLRPSIAIIPSWSVNDGTSTAQFDSGWNSAMQAIELCSINNIVPIIMTPPCFNGMNASAYTNWKYIRDAVLSLRRRILVLDVASTIGDMSTGAYLSGMTSDGTHPTDLAIPLGAAAMYDILKGLT